MATSGLLTQGLGFSASPSMVLTHGLSSGSSTTLTGSPIITVGLGYGTDADKYIITRGLGVAPPPTPRDTLFEALLGYLTDNYLTTVTGGFVADVAPPRTTFPFGRLTEVTEEWEQANTSGGLIVRGQIQLSLFGTSKSAIRAVGNTLANAINDASLVFDEGKLMYLRQSSRFSQIDPDRSPSGSPLYQEVRVFDYRYSRKSGA